MAYGPPDESPLVAKDYTKLQEALNNLARARRKIQLGKDAGIPCDGQEAECDYLQDRIEKLKSTYFPHKA